MGLYGGKKAILLTGIFALICCNCFAKESLFQRAKTLQRSGKLEESIEAYKEYLTQPIDEKNITAEESFLYTEALIQLMNTYQSKGEAEACVVALEEVFNSSHLLQTQHLRDFWSVMGYALSRTERTQEAEEAILKVFSLPLHNPTPENLFRDNAYAAAVFYSNPDYQDEVIAWCKEALHQAELCSNTSGVQWVKSMLGSLYKKNGLLNEAFALFQESKEEATARGDELGVLNSLNLLSDIFLYWDIPEYANTYASEAIRVAQSAKIKNPMLTAQTYINKGRALCRIGECDSLLHYTEQARALCQTMPYNSGMVDVDLLQGSYLTNQGGDSLHEGIQALWRVTQQATATNRARAYHQLAQTYLKHNDSSKAEIMLDSLYVLLNKSDSPHYIAVNYEPILNHYFGHKKQHKAEQYTKLMLQEQQVLRAKKLNFNLVESIVDLQTEQKSQELKIMQLRQTNQQLWILAYTTLSIIIIAGVIVLFFNQKRRLIIQMKRANERANSLMRELNQSNVEKEKIKQDIREFLKDHDNRQELETLSPFILKNNGETKFRQCFELLYPLFLHRLREKVPTITRREELLAMLVVLKQGTKDIAELLAIAPRSVLMLRHRFRQKIGMDTELSLENFIEDILTYKGDSDQAQAIAPTPQEENTPN